MYYTYQNRIIALLTGNYFINNSFIQTYCNDFEVSGRGRQSRLALSTKTKAKKGPPEIKTNSLKAFQDYALG